MWVLLLCVAVPQVSMRSYTGPAITPGRWFVAEYRFDDDVQMAIDGSELVEVRKKRVQVT